MCYAICDFLKKPDTYPEYKDVIINHFKLKKDYILETCQKWVDESFSMDRSAQNKSKVDKEIYQEKFDEIKKLLEAL